MSVSARVLSLLLVGAAAILLDAPANLGLLALVCVGLASAYAPDRGARRGLLIALAALVWSSVLSQSLFWPNTPRVAWLKLGPLTLWQQGAWHGLNVALRVASVTGAGLAVAWSTPADRLLAALHAMRLPPAAAFLVARSLHTAPDVVTLWRQARQARAWRGLDRRGGPIRQLRDEAALLGPVIASVVRTAAVRAEVLEVRGFDPHERPHTKRETLHAIEGAIFTLLALSLLVLGVLRLLDTASVLGWVDLPTWRSALLAARRL